VSGRRKLIVVANRAPVTYRTGDDGERVARRGAGGLVTALAGLFSHHDVTWIASAMTAEDEAAAAEAGSAPIAETARDGSEYSLRLVVHDPDAYDRFYNVVANPMLWFLQHYLWDPGRAPNVDEELHRAWDEGYVPVNERFAEAVLAELEREPGAAVCFHDYHLYLAPRIVREAAPDATLTHFVHIPWPQQDYWHLLPGPMRRAVHDGLLANDIVGFHTHRWRRNFLRSCEDFADAPCDFEDGIAEHDGRRTLVVAHPISVDPDEFETLAASPEVLAREEALVRDRPERLILRVDRTDPSKNVVRGFLAFEQYLADHPEMHGRVGMLALLNASRQDIPEYSEYLAEVERTAGAVNERFGSGGWTPIDLRVADDFAQSIAAYKQFDVLLVNAVFDGMNLIAKEAPLVNERDGVLVLSENAGAHEELGRWAVTVNPFDITGQAEAIDRALSLPPEEWHERLEAIRGHVREHDLAAWISCQLEDLDRWTAAAAR
jgi:trehalose 6-phosphate synthase